MDGLCPSRLYLDIARWHTTYTGIIHILPRRRGECGTHGKVKQITTHCLVSYAYLLFVAKNKFVGKLFGARRLLARACVRACVPFAFRNTLALPFVRIRSCHGFYIADSVARSVCQIGLCARRSLFLYYYKRVTEKKYVTSFSFHSYAARFR